MRFHVTGDERLAICEIHLVTYILNHADGGTEFLCVHNSQRAHRCGSALYSHTDAVEATRSYPKEDYAESAVVLWNLHHHSRNCTDMQDVRI